MRKLRTSRAMVVLTGVVPARRFRPTVTTQMAVLANRIGAAPTFTHDTVHTTLHGYDAIRKIRLQTPAPCSLCKVAKYIRQGKIQLRVGMWFPSEKLRKG